jgi:hypothetical protein
MAIQEIPASAGGSMDFCHHCRVLGRSYFRIERLQTLSALGGPLSDVASDAESHLLPDSFSRLTRSVCHLIGGFGILGLILFVVGYLSFTRWTIGVVLYLNHDPEFTQLLILDRSVPAYYSDKNI